MVAAGGLQLGAQQLQRQALLRGEALVRQRGAHLRDGRAQLAVGDQGARELLHDLDVVRRARAGAPQQFETAVHVGQAAPPQRRRLDVEGRRFDRVFAACRLGRLEVRQGGPVLLAAIVAFELGEERRLAGRLCVTLLEHAPRRLRVAERGPGRPELARQARRLRAGLGVEQRLHQFGVLAGRGVGRPQREHALDQLAPARRDGQRAFIGLGRALRVLEFEHAAQAEGRRHDALGLARRDRRVERLRRRSTRSPSEPLRS